MPADAPFIVAFDGPSNTGKTTLAQGLRDTLEAATLVLPCYADFAGNGAHLPPACAANTEEQLAGLSFYLDLDRARQDLLVGVDSATVVIADRSWLGLLGHVYAVEQTGGPVAYEEASQVVLNQAEELLQPQLTLFLALDTERRRARTEPHEDGAWFTSDSLNKQLNEFFAQEAPSLAPGSLETLDASPGSQALLAHTRDLIMSRRDAPNS
jgi:thymidylate kinase